MQIKEYADQRPFAVNIYRTDDALFIHKLPESFARFRVLLRPFAIMMGAFLGGEFELTGRYKNDTEVIVLRTDTMVCFRRGGSVKNFGESQSRAYPVFERFPSMLASRGRIRNELLLSDGTIVYLPIFPESLKSKHGFNEWLTNTWNEQFNHR